MKKNAVIGLLVALVGLNPAATYATQVEDKEVEDHSFMLGVVEQLGIQVQFDEAECKAKPGLFGNYYHNGSVMNLCSVGDRRERLDTMRHESWHVLQDLRDCSIKDTSVASSYFNGRGATSPFIAVAQKHYPTAQVPIEAEASWAAHTFDALAIANLIIQKGEECGMKFKFD